MARGLLAALATLVVLGAPPHTSRAPWATFTNTSTTLTLATPALSLALRARSGTLLALDDAATGARLFLGSAYDQLWALVGPSGSLNNNDASLAFSFAWAAPCLRLAWRAPPPGFAADVSVCAPDGQRFLDATFALRAPPAAPGTAWDSLWFPSMPLFNASGATVFYPQLPGLLLNASFFAAGNAANVPYPGSGTFAEFLHINASGATVSVFTVSGPALTLPHFKGLYPAPANGNGLWRYAHSIQPVNVTAGCAVGGDGGGGAASPCALGDGGAVTVRLAVGGGVLDDMRLYGAANALALPPITAKVPAALLRQLGRAPLYKVDAVELGLPFANYSAQLYPLLPRPGLVHFCAFEPVAFDHFYPDYLPPAARFGGSCDAAGAWAAAKTAGHLTMPYTNPSARPAPGFAPRAGALSSPPPPFLQRGGTLRRRRSPPSCPRRACASPTSPRSTRAARPSSRRTLTCRPRRAS